MGSPVHVSSGPKRATAIEQAEVKALLRISVEYRNGEAPEPLTSIIHYTWDDKDRCEGRKQEASGNKASKMSLILGTNAQMRGYRLLFALL